MISALTWLSSAESKVAELDSLVESSQAEDTSDVDELQREMQVCELWKLNPKQYLTDERFRSSNGHN